MNRYLIFAVAAAFLILNAPLGSAQAGINLALTKQNPFPVEPGQVMEIEVAVYNNGTSSDDLILEIAPKAPFSLLPGEEMEKHFSVSGQNYVSKSYKLKVDDSAVTSAYDIEFRYRKEGTVNYISKKLQVSVQGKPKIVLESVEMTPARPEPNDEVEVRAMLKNVGTGKAAQMQLALVPEADATTGESLIVPVLSGGTTYIGDLKAGSEATAVFRLKVANSAEYKTYMSALSVSYMDETGTSGSVSYDIGLPVKGRPVIEVLSAKVDNSAYVVDIENIGTASVKALRIDFVQNGEMKDSSVANELKPTKHKTIRFQGFSYGGAVINISYLDESNAFFNREVPVVVKQTTSNEASGEADGISALAPLLIVVVVLESYYVWRLRKRMKK